MRNAVKLHANKGTTGPTGYGGEKDGVGVVTGYYHLRCYKALLREDPELRAKRGKADAPSAYAASLSFGNKDDASVEARKRREEAEAKLEEIRAAQEVLAQDSGTVDADERADLSELIGTHDASGEEVTLESLEAAARKVEQDVALARRQEELATERKSEDNRTDIEGENYDLARDPSTLDIEDLKRVE